MKRWDEAIKDARRIIHLRPDWPKGYFRLATALLKQVILFVQQCTCYAEHLNSLLQGVAELGASGSSEHAPNEPSEQPESIDSRGSRLNDTAAINERLLEAWLAFRAAACLDAATDDAAAQLYSDMASAAETALRGAAHGSKPAHGGRKRRPTDEADGGGAGACNGGGEAAASSEALLHWKRGLAPLGVFRTA